ncbi:hypothetical protein BCR42DRAFT_424108 [Absidia repens]|uniref:Methyltransferase domain-containing protein n=1 Tax=Absidia repens TaxID=90262 RepID=A0A1X2I4U0_9FUNG|nr:hypothetical protein BCR42DRAFT_424108 [Absidia repens]
MSSRTKTVPFDSKDYWDHRFAHEPAFDWLLGWKSLQKYLEPHLPAPPTPILHLGCGNSPLAFHMAEAGYRRIVNVDYSAPVIEKMAAEAVKAPYDQLEWVTADCVQDLSATLTDCIACGDDDQLSRQHQLASQIASVQPVGRHHPEPASPYRLINKIPVWVPQPNDKPGAPDIYYYLYILQKQNVDGLGNMQDI